MNIFYNMGVKKWEKIFEKQLRIIRSVLLSDLEVEYENLNLGGDLGQYFDTQVVNNLLGVKYCN